MRLKGIRLVAFDATNTLLKFRVPPWQYYEFVARDYGFTGSTGELKKQMLQSYQTMWKKHPNFGRDTIAWKEWWRQVVKSTFLNQLPTNANVDIIAERLINEFKTTKCWEPQDGAEKLLNIVKNRGITIGIISNFDPRLHEILENVSLIRYIDFVVTSYEVGHSKPHGRIFQEAILSCKFPVTENECLHVGDDVERDYEGARQAGWHAVVVNNQIKTKIPPAPEHVFSSLISLAIAIDNDEL